MTTVTRGEIKTRALRLADYQSSNFADTDALNQWAEDGYAEFYDIVSATLEDFYIADPVEVTIASGNSEIDLSTAVTNFYTLKGLDYQYDGTRFYHVKSFNFNERNRFDHHYYNVDIHDRKQRRYRLIGNKIKIVPAELAPGTYRIWYIPTITAFANDSSSFEDHNGWGEYVANYIAMKIKTKSEEDTSKYEKEMAKIIGRISAKAASRDQNKIDTITDVDSLGFNYHEYI